MPQMSSLFTKKLDKLSLSRWFNSDSLKEPYLSKIKKENE